MALVLAVRLLAAPVAAAQTPALPSAPALLVGLVTDAASRETLPGATVFLAGTQRGTVADAEGRYRLAGIPAGRYEAIVTMPGYRVRQQPVTFAPGDSLRLNVALAPADLRLPGLVVEDDGRAWRRNFAQFRGVFLGEVPNARQCTIVNDHALQFGREGEVLKGRTTEPLIVENRALGYRLTYALDDFEHNPRTGLIRWRGGAFFAPLTPRDAREQRRWAEARQEAYRGSLKHFLRSLAAGTHQQEGFRLYTTPTLALDVNTLGQVMSPETPAGALLSPGALLAPTPQPNAYTLRFPGFLQVLYSNEAPHPDYATSSSRISGARYRVSGQRSALQLLASGSSFLPSGDLLDPYAMTSWGYWAWENRVANMLPFEYAPAEG